MYLILLLNFYSNYKMFEKVLSKSNKYRIIEI